MPKISRSHKRTKDMTLTSKHQVLGTGVTQTSGRLLHGATIFQRTPASPLQASGQAPISPRRSGSSVSAFQAFLEAVSPSRFYGWINRDKRNQAPRPWLHAGGSKQNPILDSLAWPLCLCDVSQVLTKALNSHEEKGRAFPHFLLTV